MKRRKNPLKALLAGALMLSMTVSAHAADYTFDGVDGAEFYPSTSYEDIYGSRYNYGGQNVVDFNILEIPYGVYSSTSTGAMEKVRLPSQVLSGSAASIQWDSGYVDLSAKDALTYSASESILFYQQPVYTNAADMVSTDGSIGVLEIPSLNISMKVWEGETNESMSKGLGHYASTSAWDGNVGVCGHNRGARYVIGDIKDLEAGDTVTYTTVYGTRTYQVSFVGTISSTDWSYLQSTPDNRITITTCLANQPTKRVCVQAIEVA